MLQTKQWAITAVAISLTVGCATNAKTEADAAMQATLAAQAAQSQKALDELNQQIKSQSNVLNAALAKAVPDHGAAQRLEAAREAEKRQMVETNIGKAPEWFLRDETGADAIYVTATEGSVDMQLSIDAFMHLLHNLHD
jgi:hypothetical protein